MSVSNHTKACARCPFSRQTERGYLGGSPPETYVGQLSGPFWIPCHMSGHYNGKASDIDETQECAGSAIFRANLWINPPPSLLHLPADNEAVFSSFAEFYAYHASIELAEALKLITPEFVENCAKKELADCNVRLVARKLE